MNRRGFLSALIAAPAFIPAMAQAAGIRSVPAGFFRFRSAFKVRLQECVLLERRTYSPDLASFPRAAVNAIEPTVGAPLRVEWGRVGADNVGSFIKPSDLHAHLQNAFGEVEGGNRIYEKGDLATVSATSAQAKSAPKGGRGECLDLRESGMLYQVDVAWPVVKEIVPDSDLPLIKDFRRHFQAPSVGVVTPMVSESVAVPSSSPAGSHSILRGARAE